MTATHPGDELRHDLVTLTEQIGTASFTRRPSTWLTKDHPHG
jgi:hypothetical protein